MWHDHVLPRLRDRGLGLDRDAETLRLTGIGESQLVDLIGTEALLAANPRMATYARPDAVDVRISATADSTRTAKEIVALGVESLSPRVDRYVFAHGEDGWPEAITARLGERRVAAAEIGTAGYLGATLGMNPWLVLDRQTWPESNTTDVAAVCAAIRTEAGTEVGVAVRADERQDGDLQVAVAVDIDGNVTSTTHQTFRGGDIGRRRAANIACAELWKRLAD
jgi:hypothetical protein